MKPLVCVPPAQAEALYDTQEDLRNDLRLDDRAARMPWRDEENLEEALSYSLMPSMASDARRQRMHSAQRR
jgi:hypothetical protein